MNVQIPEAGRYVVAVSGGVDSMVLLDILRRQPNLELVVAHYNHGIREDSNLDKQLVENYAKQRNLIFETEQGRLGPQTNEATARDKRYDFLRRMQLKHNAQAIITAHHQDDLLETAILNMLRGTGRKGLSSLASRSDMIRPLLNCSKSQIYDYAQQHNIEWREDSTNDDEKYLRNYIRRQIMPRLQTHRQELLNLLQSTSHLNQNIDRILQAEIEKSDQLQRQWFIMLPYDVSREVIATWLRQNNITVFDRPLIERLTVAAKTKPAGKIAPINAKWQMQIDKQEVRLQEINKSRV